jgi:sigma-B regulation protein RsbU (phosphoserine phosphatase)
MARRLLLVDDSSTMRRMIGALLLGEGYEVSAAVDGQDGLAKARELIPELILSDYEMPELDGPGFCQALKADPALRPIPVIMLTTLGASEHKVVGLDAGADDYIEKPRGPSEVQELFARIRAQLRIADLRNELAERNKELEAAKAKLDLELKLARKVQRGLMPPAPKPRGAVQMAVRYHPANELGGDVYDIVRLDGNRLGILVADISGHGVNSALLSGVVKAIATPLMTAGLGPGPVLAGLDAGVEQFFPEGFFCTAFYAIVDEGTGEITYGGVGHPPALIVGPDGSRQLESDPGLIGVGMVEGLEGGTDRLAIGESLLIYTDGLPDAMDPNDVAFNTDKILVVLGQNASSKPGEILDQVEKAVADHVAPGQPHDDINLVLVQRPAG